MWVPVWGPEGAPVWGPVEAEVDKLAEAWLGAEAVVALLMGRAKVLS